MRISRFKTPIALTVLLLLIVAVVVSPVWAQQESAASAISSARNTILNCYTAAREAEAAGANITVLTSTLNDAVSLLSQAELAYGAGDFEAAFDFASQSQSTLANFVGEANALREVAVQQQNQDYLVYVGSIIGTFAVLFAGFVVWVLLKRKYEQSEVHVSESSRV